SGCPRPSTGCASSSGANAAAPTAVARAPTSASIERNAVASSDAPSARVPAKRSASTTTPRSSSSSTTATSTSISILIPGARPAKPRPPPAWCTLPPTRLRPTPAAPGCVPAPAPPPPAERVEPVLQAATQALMDAVAKGDAAVWDRTLAADMVYTAEDGAVKDKAALLAELQPLPPGITGTIEVIEFRARDYGDFAVATWVADEHEVYFGH